MNRAWVITGLGIGFGALAGWFHWSHWGCTNGCTITGDPVNSSLYGAVMGGLLVNTFKRKAQNKKKNT
ncbi:MAG: hypothetical protein KDC00_03835 [Flavobacteriales bacterium]|nr:hypothetical protein [Flavobacteriales bacterium]MCB0769517.1 hypothetical protein [Flavobacteriales bacterium]